MSTSLRRALVVLLLLQALWPASVPSAGAEPLGSADAVLAQAVANQSQASVTGVLVIKYGDPQPGSRRAPTDIVTVTDDAGTRVAVTVGPTIQSSEPLFALNGTRVTITGVAGVRAAEGSGAPEPVIAAQAISRVGTFRPAAPVAGTTRWATLLCRFPDDPVDATTPYPIPYFEALVNGPEPSAEHYWQENSRGVVNFAGSTVNGWSVLPKTRAQYLASGPPDVYLDTLVTDCAGAAGAGLDFNQYGGVNVILTRQLDPAADSAWGGLSNVTLGGVARQWPVTWEPEFGYRNQHVIAHEMGHAFRLLHSSGPYTQTYDSNWDVMSGGGMCRNPHATYGCLGVHTNAFHKDFLGWIPADRRFDYTGTSQTFTLSRTAFPDTTAGTFWAAKIPMAGSTTQFYFVEARKFTGYDREAPFESIVIHKVDTTRTDRLAQVVDPDNNQNPNDAGAAWTPGETFTDTANNVAVSVLAATATGFQVRIGPANVVTPPQPTGPGSSKITTRRVGPGRIEVTVDAVNTVAVPQNTLRELRFGAATNATVEIPGGPAPFGGNQAITVAGTPTRTVFFINRVAPGAFTVRFDVADGVGIWKTFAGGGAGVP